MAFEADEKNPGNRQDGFIETSIAWEDDEIVIDFCFANCKDNFIHGAVKLPTKEIDHIKSKDDIGRFSYERDAKPENGYHGNLLFESKIDKRSRRLIESSLALFSSKVILNTRLQQI